MMWKSHSWLCFGSASWLLFLSPYEEGISRHHSGLVGSLWFNSKGNLLLSKKMCNSHGCDNDEAECQKFAQPAFNPSTALHQHCFHQVYS